MPLRTLIAGLCFFSLSAVAATADEPRRAPNIVFLIADDLGVGELGCYGQKIIRTPRLDALAEQGMRFTQHYSGFPVCAPARCTLMTGRHAGHSDIRDNGNPGKSGNCLLQQLQSLGPDLGRIE